MILKVMYEDNYNSWGTYLYDRHGFKLGMYDYFYFKCEAVDLARKLKKENKTYKIEIYDKRGYLKLRVSKFYKN